MIILRFVLSLYNKTDLKYLEIMKTKLNNFQDLGKSVKIEDKKFDHQQFTRNGISLTFYRKEPYGPFYFEIANNPELTQKLLDSVKTKAIQEKKIRYALDGIFSKIKEIQNGNFTPKPQISNQNPIVELGLISQRKWGANIVTEVLDKIGADHEPTILTCITLPNSMQFTGYGSNQKIAKQNAANEALEYLRDNI